MTGLALLIGGDRSDMVPIPAGVSVLGGGLGEGLEGPTLYENKAFSIDRYEVTNRQYTDFVTATGHRAPMFADEPDLNQPAQPVTGVSWDDANEYCRWAGKRLPTEVEWESAARGQDGRTYPWGNSAASGRAWLSGEAPVRVSAYPADKSVWGVRDMAGNVAEWVQDTSRAWGGICGKPRNPALCSLPGGVASPTDLPLDQTEACAFIKGNSFAGLPHMTASSNRMWDYADSVADFVGFRCAKDGVGG